MLGKTERTQKIHTLWFQLQDNHEQTALICVDKSHKVVAGNCTIIKRHNGDF